MHLGVLDWDTLAMDSDKVSSFDVVYNDKA